MCTRCRWHIGQREKEREKERGRKGRGHKTKEKEKEEGKKRERERERERENEATTKIVWWRASRWSRTNPIDIPFFRECLLSIFLSLGYSVSPFLLSLFLSSVSLDLSLTLVNFVSLSRGKRESDLSALPTCPFLLEKDVQPGTAEEKRKGRHKTRINRETR